MKKIDYEKLDFKGIMSLPVDRREFLKGLGGGIIILFYVGAPAALAARRRRGDYPEDLNAYLRIGADGRVTCFTGKIEMGQGVVTSLAQMLADELDVSLDSVDMVMGDTDRCPWDVGTFGSLTTRFFGPPLRQAGATARAVLIELASEQLKVPAKRLVAKDGTIFDKNNKNKLVTYAQLAKGKTIARSAKSEAELKSPSEFKVMGKDALRSDAVEKVTGEAKFAADIRLGGMLYARILRPPAHGAELEDVDASAAKKLKGVQVVEVEAEDEKLVAVLCATPDEAGRALAKIKAEWDVPKAKVDDKNIFEHLLNSAEEREVVERGGNIKKGEKLADVVIEQTYLDGYVAHAPMEPHSACAKVEGKKATVWASTQTPFSLKDEVAEVLDIPEDNVRIITPFVGGGFGGKSRNRQAVEAAVLSKTAGRPVQVAWTRAEEFFYDSFRPAAVVKIRSGIDKSGKIVFWDYGVYFAGERGSQHFYDIPHHVTAAYYGEDAHPFDTGAWRAPANNTNTFARESQIDIMAAKAQMDPVEFRLKNMVDKRMIRTLKAAAAKFGWAGTKAPSGRGFGVACGTDVGTCVATIAEVQVNKKTGHVQVKRVVCAQDMGLVINPQGATLQVEGCVTMGLGYALSEDVHFKGGKILDLNFSTYELPRFSWVPKIETVLLDLKDEPAQGGGEPGIIVMGGVIANAIYDATGARVLHLPMTPERIKEAMTRL
jgi:isoquinoline 1-oxidoreductase